MAALHPSRTPRCRRDSPELRAHLAERFGHASYERVLSGPGLVNVHRFLRDTGRGEDPPGLDEALASDHPAAAIAEAGRTGRSTRCAQALEIFLGVYGAEAGNLALRTLATGGVYVAGGIAAKLFRATPGVARAWADRAREVFRAAFVDKGRLRLVLEPIPVLLVLDETAALLGAAHVALRATAR